MIALYIILIIFLLLLILAFVRVGVLVEYGEKGLLIKLKFSPLSIRVFPLKKKGKKTKKEKETKGSEPLAAEKTGGTFELVRKLLPVIADAAGGLKEKISVDEFEMDIIWRAPDPFKCALGFGAANAAVGMFWPVLEQNFHVKNRQIRTALDFRPGTPSVHHLTVQMTMRVWQLVVWAVRLAVRLSKIYRDVKKKQETKSITQQKEAV